MSTMLEAFDTQMVDFQTDPDYSMQVSSSDIWFQEEATMEDDGHTPLQTTIEVDMESYDEHQPEYEMEDDLETGEAASTDIHDVEVYDASRFQSPDITHGGSPIPPLDSSEPPPITTEYTEPSNYVLSSSEATQEDFISHVEYHRSPSPHQPDASIPLATEEPTPPTQTLPQIEDRLEGAGLTVTNDDVHDSSSVVVEEPQLERQPEVEDLGESTSGGESHPEGENFETVEHPEPSSDEANLYAEEYTAPPEFENSTSDPHEISEGVYIDPPPPVLISLSADRPSISLFNLPSNLHLTSQLDNESDAPDLVVLLGQHPTLYYEPLSSVFEALRQEEHLSGIPGLLSGELLLDAYDLELTMSEDYTYAHELSLHDLNVLHDGLHRVGPLRLRLKSATPRFIDRYHLLQSQIAHFQIVESTSEREISRENHTTEEDSGAEHVTEAEASGKDSTTEAEVPGVGFPAQIEDSGADSVTDAGARNEEVHQDEDAGDQESVSPENQQDGPETEQEKEAFEESYDPEEEYISEESTAPIVETDNTDEVNNRTISGSEAGNVDDDDDHQEDIVDFDSHADDPQQQKEFEQENTENASTELIDEQHLDVGDEIDVPISIQGKDDIEGIDARHLDENESREDNEESGPVVSNAGERVVELDSTTEVNDELNQTNFLVDVVNYKVTEDVVDGPDDNWNDTLDGDGDWEVEDGHEQGDEYSYDHEHGHEREHDTVSNSSSVTLSSKSSFKRSLSEAELEQYVEDDSSPGSPDPKKPRVE